MYEAFFELREKPFSLLPDPSFLFLSRKHEEALTLLEYGLLNQAGFIVLTGEIGSGKTTLMRYLLDRLDERVTVGLISHTHQSLGELMEWICLAFDIRIDKGSKLDQYQAFLDFLIDQYGKGRRVLLIVDEAQNLGVEKLEELRLLSNINADKDFVLQLMLLGQPQLRKLLQRQDLEQFVQRIAASYHLGRLSPPETAQYIQHRIAIAGGTQKIFTDDACHAVHHYSTGIPRVINLICDTALVQAYGAGERCVTGADVDEFIASHAPHLLIPIERDASARPLPRTRLPEEDAEDTGDRGTATGSPDLVSKPGVAAIKARAAESTAVDDRSELFLSPPPVPASPVSQPQVPRAPAGPPGPVWEALPHGAPDPARTVQVQAQGDSIPTTASVLHSPAAPLHSAQSGSMRGPTAANPGGVQGGLLAAASKGPDPVTQAVAEEETRPTPGQRSRKAPWVLLALSMLVATGLTLLWFGGSSTREWIQSAVIDRLQGDRANDQKGTVGVAPATPEPPVRPLASPAPGPIAERSPKRPEGTPTPGAEIRGIAGQPPRQAPVSRIGEGVVAVEAETGDSANPVRAVDGEVQVLEASAPISSISPGESADTPNKPTLADTGGLTATDSAGTLEVPRVEGEGSRTESLASDQSAAPLAPSSRTAQSLPVAAGGNEDAASPIVLADHGTPATTTEPVEMGQLERQFNRLSLEVRRKADRLIADLGGSVQFPVGSAELDGPARAALRRVAELLKDPMTNKVLVIGYTDSSGTESFNQWLSDRRARNVASYLSANGVATGRLTHQGRGKNNPKVAVEQEQIQGAGVNRRIELEIFDAERDPG